MPNQQLISLLSPSIMFSSLVILSECFDLETEWCGNSDNFFLFLSSLINEALKRPIFIKEMKIWFLFIGMFICLYPIVGTGPVKSESMEPTLKVGQRVVWLKQFRTVRNGIYIFEHDEIIMAKRLVGLPVSI